HDQERRGVDGERRQRQTHVVGEHECQAIDVRDRGVDEVQDARPEQHAHRRHVVHQPRHQVARVPLLIEGERQPLQVREEVVAEVVLDVAADVEDDEAREGPHQALEDGDRDDQPEIREEHTAAVAPRLAALAPSAVVNAAADNRVDAAEQDPAPAMAVNALGVAALAEACRRSGALLVHMSTDYVFDGRAGRPYTEDDPPSPLGAYARSKLAGELLARALAPRHAVVRLAALYAAGGAGFVDRVLARARTGGRLRVVHDQVTAPTWARDVAAALARLLPRLVRGDAPGGIYHLTNAGACSWYEFAR